MSIETPIQLNNNRYIGPKKVEKDREVVSQKLQITADKVSVIMSEEHLYTVDFLSDDPEDFLCQSAGDHDLVQFDPHPHWISTPYLFQLDACV